MPPSFYPSLVQFGLDIEALRAQPHHIKLLKGELRCLELDELAARELERRNLEAGKVGAKRKYAHVIRAPDDKASPSVCLLRSQSSSQNGSVQ